MFLFEGGIAFCNFASLRQNGNKFFFGGNSSMNSISSKLLEIEIETTAGITFFNYFNKR